MSVKTRWLKSIKDKKNREELLLVKLQKAKMIIADLLGPRPCKFDHHNRCTEHGSFGSGCMAQQAIDFLKEFK